MFCLANNIFMVAPRLSASHKTDYDCWLEFFVAHCALWFVCKSAKYCTLQNFLHKGYEKSNNIFYGCLSLSMLIELVEFFVAHCALWFVRGQILHMASFA